MNNNDFLKGDSLYPRDGIVRSYTQLNDPNLILLFRRIEKGGVERFEQYDTKILGLDERIVYYYKIKS